MFPEPIFWLLLVLKMALTAGFVVFATFAAERAGPVVGAMIATLPVSAGPAYAFVALHRDASFIADSALASLSVNVAAAIFALVYAKLAQRHGLAASVLPALAVWAGLATLINSVAWTTTAAAFFNVVGLALCIAIADRFPRAPVPLVPRHWTDLVLRAAMVAVLVALVVTASEVASAAVTGILAVFPIVLTSLALILHPRIGGPATATVLTSTMVGLAGFSFCCFTAHVLVEPLGKAAGLCAALAVSIGWNFCFWMIRRRAAVAVSR